MSITRYTTGRLVKAMGGRAADATMAWAGGALDRVMQRTVSLLAGKDSWIWNIGADDRHVRMLDSDPDGIMALLSLNEIIFACLRERCNVMISPAFTVERRKDDGTYEAEPDHPLARLIKRPADNIDTETLWRCMEVSYSSLGKVYLEPLYTQRRRQLDGLMPLNPAWMREELDGDGNLTAYRYEVPGLAPVVFGPNDLITRRAVLWASPPPLIAALGAADADAVANQFISGFFSGGGIPSSIIKTRDDWTQERADDFRADWVKRFSGANRLPAILGRSIESYERIGVSLNELDNETLRMYIETRLCMCFGVPPLIIYAYAGLLKSTYSNLDEAWESFWDACALPLLREWANWITWSLLTLFEDSEAVRSGDVRCRFDVAGIGPYQEDVTAKVAMFSTGFKDRAVTLNEYRGAMGLSRMDGGDELPEPEPEPEPEPDEPDEPDEAKTLIIPPRIEVMP